MITKTIVLISMLAVALAAASGPAFAGDSEDGKDYGVYQYVVRGAQGSFDEIAQSLEAAVGDAGWRLLATVDAGAPKDCKFRARVFIVYDESYAAEIMKANRKTGPYAVLDRVNLFEDENGTHVSVVNPHSITRTVLMDDTSYEALSETHLQALRAMVTSAVEGTASDQSYGQVRSEGFIGKTMGVVAGGKFGDLIQDKAKVEDAKYVAVAAKLRAGLAENSKKWGMHTVFELDMPEFGVFLFGTTGTPMDSKSFDIVKAGADESRKDFECPGLAHAGAYPIELVVSQEDDDVEVSMVEAMFRMKMYFEDAGKWAFMNNMKMPGSIDKDLKKQIKSGTEDD